MKPLQVVLLILGIYALLHVTSQSFRHVFVAYIEPRTSILTTLEPVKVEIAATASQEELVARYKEARAEVDQWNRGKTRKEIRDAEASDEEPHNTAQLYRGAIFSREQQDRQLRELHFYWWCGLVCLAVGLGCWRGIHPWLGTAFFIVAFAEMLYWTSPESRLWSAGEEFVRLVQWKLIYSAITFAVLIGVWLGVWLPLRRQQPHAT